MYNSIYIIQYFIHLGEWVKLLTINYAYLYIEVGN